MKNSYRLYARRYPGPETHVPFLAPWWGVPLEDASSLNRGQFDRWAAMLPEAYTLVEALADSDVVVLSISWKATRQNLGARVFANEEIRAAGLAGKQIVIFFDSDHDEEIDWPTHAIVFRFSIYADTCRTNEFAIPTFSQDFLAEHYDGTLATRAKTSTPSVSFCGYAPPLGGKFSIRSLKESARYLAYRLKLLKSRRRWIAHAPRVQAIRTLRRARSVDCRFVVRKEFAFNQWGVLQPGGSPDSAKQQRQQFLDNLDDADYALCTRGLANCSIRFYEALSLGRLPLFVNTRCVLPYDWLVDWKKIGLWVDARDLPRIGEILRAHYARLTPESFVAQQHAARALFEKWIRPENFFAEMHRHFSLGHPVVQS
ncbi:exostosin domain-containing protein [Oleiharenicola lentus]|uniref:exostosin domain-containing protein n=1 Tax=Oleiharenicola lentus TaxID=2508720 RepID=UPI003F66A98C